MSKIFWWFGLIKLFFSMSLQSTISYFRWSFLSLYISHVMGYLSSYVVIWTTIRMFHSVNGWGFYEIAFLYSLDLLSYSLSQTFLQPFWDMDGLVVQGKLDEYLIRPVNPLIYLIGRNIQFGYISHISLGFAVIIFAVNKLDLHWGALEWCLFIVTLFGGVLIQAAISIIPSCAAFWLSKSEHLANFLRWDVREYILYPISIYPGFIRALLTVVVPFALVNYYPSFRLLGKAGINGVLQIMPGITLFVGIVLILISYSVWKIGLRRYNSSGT